MTITQTSLISYSENADQNSYSTGSFTPSANKLVLAAVMNTYTSTATLPTLSGNGLTWVEVATTLMGSTSRARVTVFRAMGGSPSAGALTADFAGATQTSCLIQVSEFDGVDTTGTHGSGAVVQSATNSGSSVSALTVTLSAFGDAGNGAYAAFGLRNNTTVTPDTGWTEIYDVGIGTPNSGLETQWRADNDTTAGATPGSASDMGGVAIEIKAASGAVDLVVAEGSHAQGAESVTLTQTHSLVVQDATVGQTAQNVDLSQVHALVVSETNHGQGAESVTLTQTHSLAVQDATVGQTAQNVDLSQVHALVVSETNHGQGAENLSLTQSHVLSVADGTHDQMAVNVDLNQAHVLEISATSHTHQAEQIELSAAIFLVIADGVHGHIVESLSLEQAHTLAVLPALHEQMAEGLSLGQTHVLNLASTAHAHTAEQVVFQTGAPWDHTLQRGLRRGIDRRMER